MDIESFKVKKNTDKGYLEQFRDLKIEEIMKENKELFESIEKDKKLKDVFNDFYQKIIKKSQSNEKMKKISLILFSILFIEGCSIKLDNTLEISNYLEYYSKQDFYDALAKIKKACEGSESNELVFCEQYKEYGDEVVITPDKDFFDKIENSEKKLTDEEIKKGRYLYNLYHDFGFINTDEYEDNSVEAELHLGKKGDCSTFATTFYNKLVNDGVIDKKDVFLSSGTVEFGNDGDIENHMYIIVKINKKTALIVDNNGIGIAEKKDNKFFIKSLELIDSNGGGYNVKNISAEYTLNNYVKQ